MTKQPVLIDLEPTVAKKKKTAKQTPADAPVVPEIDVPLPPENNMQTMTSWVARKPSFWTRLFWWSLLTLIGFVVSVAFWDFVTAMMDRNFWLGRAALTLIILCVSGVLVFAMKELAAFARLRRLDSLRAAADAAYARDTVQQARNFSDRLERLYQGRRDLAWAFAKVKEQRAVLLDADAHMALVENTVMSELDKQATKEIESASRQVATATALIPLAFADVVVALTVNIRMIRRIAEVYGGRSGTFGSWRLLKVVAAHLVATGAVAIGDDMIGAIAGGGVLSKISRRFGEGIVNGALTARVGLAAMDVCRPMPFRAAKKPSVTAMMRRALVGFIGKGG